MVELDHEGMWRKAKALVRKDDVDWKYARSGKTLLHKACEKDYPDVALYLIKNGASLDARPKYGKETPLLAACRQNSVSVILSFMEEGVFGIDDLKSDIDLFYGVVKCAVCSSHKTNGILLLERLVDAGMTFDSLRGFGDLLTQTMEHHYAGGREKLRLLLQNGYPLDTLEAGKGSSDPEAPHPLTVACSSLLYEDYALAMLDCGARPDVFDEKAMTSPFFEACQSGSFKVAERLLDKLGGTVNMNDLLWGKVPPKEYLSALHCLSSQDGNVGLLKRILEEHDVEIDLFESVHFRTPLLTACREGNVEAARLLLEHGACPTMPDIEGRTPLHYACARGDLSLVIALIERGVPLNARDSRGQTPLHYLVLAGSSEQDEERLKKLSVLKYLIGQGAFVDCRDKANRTPTHYACEKLSVEQVRTLLESGASPFAKDEGGDTPMMKVASGDIKDCPIRGRASVEVIELLREYGEDVTSAKDGLLYRAVENNNLELLLHLKKLGVSVRKGEYKGNSLMNMFFFDYLSSKTMESKGRSRSLEVLRFLLDEGVDLADCAEPPLHRACHIGDFDVVSMLVDHGADVNEVAHDETPLMTIIRTCNWMAHEPAHKDRFELIVKLLILNGADVQWEDSIGNSAMSLLKRAVPESTRVKVEEWLREYAEKSRLAALSERTGPGVDWTCYDR